MKILGIDPGPEHSAFVVWDGGRVLHCDDVPNETMRVLLRENLFGGHDLVAIEMVACYGMAVGAETFETVRWIGRFEERARPVPVRLVYRKDIKMHLCHSMRAKDANVSQALKDRFGKPGTKKNPGPLFGISEHKWSALAVAVYAFDTQ